MKYLQKIINQLGVKSKLDGNSIIMSNNKKTRNTVVKYVNTHPQLRLNYYSQKMGDKIIYTKRNI